MPKRGMCNEGTRCCAFSLLLVHRDTLRSTSRFLAAPIRLATPIGHAALGFAAPTGLDSRSLGRRLLWRQHHVLAAAVLGRYENKSTLELVGRRISVAEHITGMRSFVCNDLRSACWPGGGSSRPVHGGQVGQRSLLMREMYSSRAVVSHAIHAETLESSTALGGHVGGAGRAFPYPDYSRLPRDCTDTTTYHYQPSLPRALY